ncbi:MAG: hypothetical protein ACRC6V_02765 [Bacteroidales bacterium]
MSLFSNDMRIANTAAPSFQSEANVGQFGWTNVDQAHYNQLVQYVDECRKIWLSLEDKIEYIDELLIQLGNIEAQVKYVELMTQAVISAKDDTFGYAQEVLRMYTEVRPLYQDFLVKYEDFATKYVDVVAKHGETLVASQRASVSEVNAAKSAKEASDLVDELRKGQVYRGTWNIERENKYPPIPVTNSVWDIILNESSLSFVFNGETWFWGDRLMYLKDENKFIQVESGSTVTSVNGKSGAVTLSNKDVGAAPGGYGLGEYGRSLADQSCNDATATGWYSIFTSTTGGPLGSGPSGSVLHVIRWSSSATVSVVHQTFYSYTSDRVFQRRMYNSVWQPWVELYSTGKKPTPSEIGAVTVAGFTLEGPIKVGNQPSNIQNLMNTNMIRSGGAGSHATVVGNTSARTYIDSPDEILLLRANGVERKIYTEGYKPNAADVGAYPLTGGRVSGTVLIDPGQDANPINAICKPNAAGASAMGLHGFDSTGGTRQWGVGNYYNQTVPEFTYLGIGATPWAGGLRVKTNAIEAYQPVYVSGSLNSTVYAGGPMINLNYNAGDGGYLRGMDSGVQDWYVGRANNQNDVAFYSNKHTSGVILRSNEVEFTTPVRVGGAGTVFYTKPLLSTDLNSLHSSVSHGMYYQDATANATSARNYPIAEAGSLIVMGGAYGAQQEYTSYASNRKFIRGKNAAGGAVANWRSWTELGASKNYISARDFVPTAITTNGAAYLVPRTVENHNGMSVNTSNGLFTINKTGVYKLSFGFTLLPGAAVQNVVADLTVNSAIVKSNLVYNYVPTSATNIMSTASYVGTVSLTAGNTLAVRARAVNSTTANIYPSGYIMLEEL